MNGNFLITGAAGGFGAEFSRRVLEGGGRVVMTDTNTQAGTQLCSSLQQRFGEDSCIFEEHDVTDKAQWKRVWKEAESFFKSKIDTLVNNAGVSPVLGFDICMKINLDGVLHGCSLFEEKQGRHQEGGAGGAGGLVINIASCAGLTRSNKHTAMAYWISKHSVVAMTRTFGNSSVAKKTGVKHVALCPWFAETGIIDPNTRKTVMERSPLKFVPVQKVGEALELAVKEQKTGSLICVLPNAPLIYYPDTLMLQGVLVFLLSKIAGMFGARTVSTGLQSLVLLAVSCLFIYCCHLSLDYAGF